MQVDKCNVGFIIIILEGDELHVDIELVLLEKERKLRSLSIEDGRFTNFGFFK